MLHLCRLCALIIDECAGSWQLATFFTPLARMQAKKILISSVRAQVFSIQAVFFFPCPCFKRTHVDRSEIHRYTHVDEWPSLFYSYLLIFLKFLLQLEPKKIKQRQMEIHLANIPNEQQPRREFPFTFGQFDPNVRLSIIL